MKKKFTLFLFLGITANLLSACSSSKEELKTNEESFKSDNPTLSFTEEENGKLNHYEVEFADDSILALSMNGKKIKNENIANYEDLIYDKLNDLNREKHFSFNFDGSSFNKKEFKDKMKKLKEELKNKRIEINANIFKNDSLIKKSVKKALKRIKKTNHYKFHFDFDEDDLENAMEKLNEELENLDLDFDMNIDVDVDMDEIKIEIDKAMKKLGEVHIELNDLDEDLKKMDSFMDDLKSELVKDKLIKSKDEKIDIEIHSNEMTVNDKKVSDALLKKYKNLYKKHLGKEIEEDQSFEIHK